MTALRCVREPYYRAANEREDRPNQKSGENTTSSMTATSMPYIEKNPSPIGDTGRGLRGAK